MKPLTVSDPPVRLGWGPRGCRLAVQRSDILVVVDVLRYSSAVASAVAADCWIYPAAPGEEDAVAERYGAECASPTVPRPGSALHSLSPESFSFAEKGARIVLSSMNGAVCSRHGAEVNYLFAAGLVNASAVGRVVSRLARETGLGVSIVACGERWGVPSEEGTLRFAVEDYLGAGGVLSSIEARLTPEAEVCRSAFEASRRNLRGAIWESESGIELREKGLPYDVNFCSAVDVLDAIPVYRDGCFREYRGLDL